MTTDSLKYFRGFKGKRSNPQEVSSALIESQTSSKNQFSNDGSFLECFKKQNQFSNDGSFLEQFKKMKSEPKVEAIEPKLNMIEPKLNKIEPKKAVEEAMPSQSQQNDWYKAALARAKQIAHTMTETKKDVPEPPIKHEPKGINYNAVFFQILRFPDNRIP